jgi:hypothetical protein
VANIQVTHETNPEHARSESFVAINPKNSLQIVSASKKFLNIETYDFILATQYSTDGGQTWTESADLDLTDAKGTTFTAMTDPTMAWDDSGSVFLVGLVGTNDPPAWNSIGLVVYTSTDGGQTWSAPQVMHSGDDDKQWAAADNTNPASPYYGNVYVVWDDVDTTAYPDGAVLFARTTDNGTTWKGTGTGTTDPGSLILTGGSLPEIDVGDDGTVYVVVLSDPDIQMIISTDGGDTFPTTTSPALGITSVYDAGLPVAGPGVYQFPYFPGGNFRVITDPTVCVNGKTVLVAWTDMREGVARIYYTRSTDGGQTWPAAPLGGQPLLTPAQDSRIPANTWHFFPQMVVDPNGVFGCVFYEFGPKPSEMLIDVILAQSFDDGVSFDYFIVTDQPWNPALDAPWAHGDSSETFIGDYFGLAASERGFYPLWTDTRTTGIQELWTDIVPAQLPAVSLILDRSTFGRDEVNELLPDAAFTDAFWVVVDGCTPDQLGLTVDNLHSPSPPNLPTFAGSFAALAEQKPPDPAITFDSKAGVQLEEPGQLRSIQRITFPYTITFPDLNAFAGLSKTNTSRIYDLTASIANTAAPTGYPAISATSQVAEIELVYEADPFMLHGETWYLSNDIRVFQVTPATLPSGNVPLKYSSTPYMSTVTNPQNSYIAALLDELNKSFVNPATADTPFTGITVTPNDDSPLNLSGTDKSGNPVYNFALARVSLQGDTASGVRVFFRLFISSTPDTDFDTSTTFRSQPETDSSGKAISGTRIALLGFKTSDMPVTIPFFAEPRIDATAESMTRQPDPKNVQTIPSMTATSAPPPGELVYAYFGCWLDLNQDEPRFPLNPAAQPHPDGPYAASAVVSIPDIIMSNHACVVAEISYDHDPIPPGANASDSDKIGQRNLCWTGCGNPDPEDAHRVPALFDLRPTSPTVPATDLPDELMIEWGATPVGSVASIYWPQIDADAVLDLAGRFYRSSVLRKKDAHTIQCSTGAITYIPIPARTGPNIAGLMTVEVPMGVRVGQEFDIVVRRVSSRTAGSDVRGRTAPAAWRYVVGAFQIKIPVSTGAVLLDAEESLLGVFKWKLDTLPVSNRWHPVLERYVQQISGRVDGFGGDAGEIQPTPPGSPLRRAGHPWRHPHHHEHTGKVSGLIYDRFGDFKGFLLVTETGDERRYDSHEEEIQDLVKEAWDRRTLISVFADPRDPDRPASIILRRTGY